MVAIYSIRLDDKFYARDMASALEFVNDRSRNKKDFELKKINITELSSRGLRERIMYSEISQPYGVDRWLTPDEIMFYETYRTLHNNFMKNAKNILTITLTLKFIDYDEFCKCISGLYLYCNHIQKIIEPTNLVTCEYYNLGVLCDRAIEEWTGSLTKEERKSLWRE